MTPTDLHPQTGQRFKESKTPQLSYLKTASTTCKLTRSSFKTVLKGLCLHDAEEKEGKEAQPCVRQHDLRVQPWVHSLLMTGSKEWTKLHGLGEWSPPISNSAQSKPQHDTPSTGSTRSDAWVGFHAFNVHILSWENQIPSISCHLAISSSYYIRFIFVTGK